MGHHFTSDRSSGTELSLENKELPAPTLVLTEVGKEKHIPKLTTILFYDSKQP